MLLNLLVLLVPASLALPNDIVQRELKPVKGVGHSRLYLYQESFQGTFRCLDGSRTILFSQLNDDYCDCPDGSDEPGTSACGNAFFYCSNVGHTGNFIPTNRVNDKLCDCCDGSDEYNSGVDCPNICDELGRAARVEKERVSAIARKGFAKRKEMARQGQELRASKLKDVEPLRAEKAKLAPELAALEEGKKDAEQNERELQDEHRKAWEEDRDEKKKVRAAELFEEIDLNKDGKIVSDEMRLNLYLDENRDGLVSEDEVKTYLTVDEADSEHFQTVMYDRLKVAKKNYEEDLRQKAKEGEEAHENVPDDDELLAEEDRDEDHPADVAHHEDDEDKMPEYPPEVTAASEDAREARRQFDELNQKLADIDAKIREAEEFSKEDFGEDLAWASLKDKCFDRNVQQYTYEFCPFGQNTQKDTGAYSGTSLGSFKKWSGPEGEKYTRQHYGDGQQCWNGPKRSTDITIQCGVENELVEVTEPAKCEYEFTFRTPLACPDPDVGVHEEL
uniref:Glucosidase 2 subunit beta n=2 Tax=Caenorhabditis japonica TaxID=281687 RepID=A0A8R1I128_CAEJA